MLRSLRLKYRLSQLRRNYNGQPFTLIANNCWGSDLYQALNLPYTSPFVGLFIPAPDFIRLLHDLPAYLGQPLHFQKTSAYMPPPAYPVALLGDAEIHFQHYATAAEAEGKWERRKARMSLDPDRLFLKMDDRDFCTDAEIEAFHNLPYPHKISFTAHSYPFRGNFTRLDPNGLVRLNDTLNLVDVAEWLNSGKLQKPRLLL